MNYSEPDLLEALAQRYVLGTMSVRARRRFAEIIDSNEQARQCVLQWEERLSPMLLALDPVKPSDLVWQRIAREIKLESRPAAAPGRGLANTAVVAFLAIGISITGLGWWQSSLQPLEKVIETVVVSEPEAPAISVLADAQGSYWVARIYPKSARLDIEAQTAVTARSDRDYELWTLQDDGTPVSLGLLPQAGARTLQLDAPVIEAIARSNTLAVSLEPVGGSPQAVPTGPVLYTGALYPPQT